MSTMSFSDLKKTSSVDDARKEAESSEKKSYIDPRFWSPYFNKTNGTASAHIRFLWHSQYDKNKFVKTYSHAYKNPVTGSWLIENCPTTIGLQCPV